MFKLDSEIVGLLIAIITFLLPVISKILDKKKKKKGAENVLAENTPDENASVEDASVEEDEDSPFFSLKDVFNEVIQELSDEQQEEEPVIVTDEPEEVVVEHKPVMQESFLQKMPVGQNGLVEEAEPATVTVIPYENEQLANGEEKPDNSVRGRLKNNPKDMVLFAEIMNPKFKEL